MNTLPISLEMFHPKFLQDLSGKKALLPTTEWERLLLGGPQNFHRAMTALRVESEMIAYIYLNIL